MGQSDDLLDAGTLEAAGASLLLHLAGRAVASAPPGGQGGAGGQLDVLFVHTWWTEGKMKNKRKSKGNGQPAGGVCSWSDRSGLLRPGECWEVASEVMELDRLRLAVMLSWLWLLGG